MGQLVRVKQGLVADESHRVSANSLVSISELRRLVWRKPSEGCMETLSTTFAIFP